MDLCDNDSSGHFTFNDLFKVAEDLFESKQIYYRVPGYRANAIYLNDETKYVL